MPQNWEQDAKWKQTGRPIEARHGEGCRQPNDEGNLKLVLTVIKDEQIVWLVVPIMQPKRTYGPFHFLFPLDYVNLCEMYPFLNQVAISQDVD
mmetsp:Transcript_22705/g.48824  ORF Transcript_22705/g.48824 Transcript_22705/m.48824 type:complete len:93 (-) Transcript_22705:140-418(-)